MSSLFGSGFGTGQMESEPKPNNATVQERTEINKSRIFTRSNWRDRYRLPHAYEL